MIQQWFGGCLKTQDLTEPVLLNTPSFLFFALPAGCLLAGKNSRAVGNEVWPRHVTCEAEASNLGLQPTSDCLHLRAMASNLLAMASI